jgi:glycosyltransferase involved in cell wall biosynthesis
MNILIIEHTASSTLGGAERTLRSYCEYLAQNHKVHLVYDRTGDYVQSLAQIYASVTRISVLPFKGQPTVSWFREMLKLVRLCKERNIDLILTHVNHSASMLRVVRKLTGIKVVMLFKWICSTERVGLQAQWGLHAMDCGVSISRFTADYWIRNGFPAEKMQVVPEGVELLSSTTAGDYDTPDTPQRVLKLGFAGRICADKGLHVLLEAVSKLKSRGMAVECFVAGVFAPGDGGELQRYHTTIQEQIDHLHLNSIVHFEGWVNALTPFLRKMELIVVPSIFQECQSIVLMESMAVGTPVIASRVGGIPERMTGSFTRWLFESGNVDDLMRKIEEYLALPISEKSQLRKELRQYAVNNFSIAKWHHELSRAIGITVNS